MSVLVPIIVALISFAVGGLVAFILVKKYNKTQVKGKVAIENSEANDEKRSNIVDEANEQIRKNQELLDKLEKENK